MPQIGGTRGQATVGPAAGVRRSTQDGGTGTSECIYFLSQFMKCLTREGLATTRSGADGADALGRRSVAVAIEFLGARHAPQEAGVFLEGEREDVSAITWTGR